MELPRQLAQDLGAADEDYLIGLCNKGTVNRARKDLAGLSAPEVQFRDESAVVRWGDVECEIRTPLGESRCSCPSGSICRHRIAAMLWLKENGGAQGEVLEDTDTAPHTFEALAAYPTEKLLRQLGTKQVAGALFRLESGSLPPVSRTSVITVELPWVPATVRLLEPLEHSTCTCHSKRFCIHKAQALLYWKLSEGLVDRAALKEALQTDENRSSEEGKGICQAVQEMLSAQMTTGLSRIPDTVCDTVERMASLCRTARLPSLERALHRLHQEYTHYFNRSALYRDTKLLRFLAQSFRLAQRLEQADEGEYHRLAGEFRDEYIQVGSLSLYLLSRQQFSGNSGYSGAIYYFWDSENRCYDTLSRLRPVQEGGQSPWSWSELVWSMPYRLSDALHRSLELNGARVSSGGKLSSTELCRAVPGPMEPPWTVIPEEEIFTDFSLLLRERSAPHRSENRRLALVYPQKCIPQPYDTVEQRFSMELVDGAGRTVYLEFTYRHGSDETLEALERAAKQISSRPKLRPMFFGTVYREGDKLKLFPIEIMTDWGKRNE